MEREKRSTKSLIGRHAADCQVVGHFDTVSVLQGMADAFVDAIRVGVPVRQLPGHDVFGTGKHRVAVDVRGEQLRSLELDAAAAKKEADSASDLAAAHLAKKNASMSAHYDEVATRRLADFERLQQAHNRLATQPPESTANEPFDVRAHIWLAAVNRLRTCGGRLTQEERVAFSAIVPTFRMELVDHVWWAVATVRLNTVDGVADLGPIRWKVGAPGRGSHAALNGTAPTTGEDRTRHELVATLVATGRIIRLAALTACNAPFPQLRQILLHKLCGEPWPDWVSDQWRDTTFADWIVKVYTDPDWTWDSQAKYTTTLLSRQHAVWIATTAPDEGMLWSDLQKRLRDPSVYAGVLTSPKKARRTTARAVEPVLRSVGPTGATQQRRVTCIFCECGAKATIVARAPEVLTDLLCDCGRAAGGTRFGMPNGLRFPDEYKQMRIDQAACERRAEHRREKFKSKLTKREALILKNAHLLADGVSDASLSRALSVSSMSYALSSLLRRGLVESQGEKRKRRWFLTEAGVERAAALTKVQQAESGLSSREE